MPRTPAQANAAAKAQSQGHGPHYHEGQCLKAVREALLVPARDYSPGNGHDPWAIEAWDHAKHRHTHGTPPMGAPVFWRGRSGRPGHIALSAGDGKIWTTDAVHDGYFALEDLSWPHNHWGLTYEGWTEDLNGVLLDLSHDELVQAHAAKPAPVAAAPTTLTAAARVAQLAAAADLSFVAIARVALRAAATRNTGARLKQINTARAALKGMK